MCIEAGLIILILSLVALVDVERSGLAAIIRKEPHTDFSLSCQRPRGVGPPQAGSANSSLGARLPILRPDRTTDVIMKQRRGLGASVGADPASGHFPLPIVTPRKLPAPCPPR